MENRNRFYRVSIKGLILNETGDKFLVCLDDATYWDIPGGGLDWDETHDQCLSREIMEEMNVPVAHIADHPSYFHTGKKTTAPEIRIANVIYECTVEHLDFTPTEECREIKFVSVEEARELKSFAGLHELAKVFDPNNHK